MPVSSPIHPHHHHHQLTSLNQPCLNNQPHHHTSPTPNHLPLTQNTIPQHPPCKHTQVRVTSFHSPHLSSSSSS
ncbi:hypothetical protein KSF78_0008577 [Schistosoma japonicum]|nr:hypothetical protein KSF78_0008577 [Schistosoma japonicum]